MGFAFCKITKLTTIYCVSSTNTTPSIQKRFITTSKDSVQSLCSLSLRLRISVGRMCPRVLSRHGSTVNSSAQSLMKWVVNDIGRIFVQIFDVALEAWLGYNPSLCVFNETCGDALAIEHNGDLYSCDHFVTPDYHVGNIAENTIQEMVDSTFQRKFGTDKRDTLPEYCRSCEVKFVCNGGCPKNRFIKTPTGEDGLNYLCAGYKQFFNSYRRTDEADGCCTYKPDDPRTASCQFYGSVGRKKHKLIHR